MLGADIVVVVALCSLLRGCEDRPTLVGELHAESFAGRAAGDPPFPGGLTGTRCYVKLAPGDNDQLELEA